MVRTRISTIITIGPSLTGLRGTQLAGSISYTLISYNATNYNEINLWRQRGRGMEMMMETMVEMQRFPLSSGEMDLRSVGESFCHGSLFAATLL
jgi:hypothetical protein